MNLVKLLRKCGNDLRIRFFGKYINGVYWWNDIRELLFISFFLRDTFGFFWFFIVYRIGIYGFIGYGWLEGGKLYYRL